MISLARIAKLETAAGDPTTLTKLKVIALHKKLIDGIASTSTVEDVLNSMEMCPDVDEPVEAARLWIAEFWLRVATAIVGRELAFVALGWPEPGKTARDIVNEARQDPAFIAFKKSRESTTGRPANFDPE